MGYWNVVKNVLVVAAGFYAALLALAIFPPILYELDKELMSGGFSLDPYWAGLVGDVLRRLATLCDHAYAWFGAVLCSLRHTSYDLFQVAGPIAIFGFAYGASMATDGIPILGAIYLGLRSLVTFTGPLSLVGSIFMLTVPLLIQQKFGVAFTSAFVMLRAFVLADITPPRALFALDLSSFIVGVIAIAWIVLPGPVDEPGRFFRDRKRSRLYCVYALLVFVCGAFASRYGFHTVANLAPAAFLCAVSAALYAGSKTMHVVWTAKAGSPDREDAGPPVSTEFDVEQTMLGALVKSLFSATFVPWMGIVHLFGIARLPKHESPTYSPVVPLKAFAPVSPLYDSGKFQGTAFRCSYGIFTARHCASEQVLDSKAKQILHMAVKRDGREFRLRHVWTQKDVLFMDLVPDQRDAEQARIIASWPSFKLRAVEVKAGLRVAAVGYCSKNDVLDCYQNPGVVTAVQSDGLVRYSSYTNPGMSGSPIVLEEDPSVCIGVHVQGGPVDNQNKATYNLFVPWTAEMLAAIQTRTLSDESNKGVPVKNGETSVWNDDWTVRQALDVILDRDIVEDFIDFTADYIDNIEDEEEYQEYVDRFTELEDRYYNNKGNVTGLDVHDYLDDVWDEFMKSQRAIDDVDEAAAKLSKDHLKMIRFNRSKLDRISQALIRAGKARGRKCNLRGFKRYEFRSGGAMGTCSNHLVYDARCMNCSMALAKIQCSHCLKFGHFKLHCPEEPFLGEKDVKKLVGITKGVIDDPRRAIAKTEGKSKVGVARNGGKEDSKKFLKRQMRKVSRFSKKFKEALPESFSGAKKTLLQLLHDIARQGGDDLEKSLEDLCDAFIKQWKDKEPKSEPISKGDVVQKGKEPEGMVLKKVDAPSKKKVAFVPKKKQEADAKQVDAPDMGALAKQVADLAAAVAKMAAPKNGTGSA